LNELKKNKILIYKIKKKNEKTKIKALFSKKLMKRIIRAEEQKNDVLTIKRLSSEDIEILTRFVKTKQRLKQNKTLFKDVVITTFLSRRTFEIMIHEIKLTSINTQNQQKTITHIIRQNASLHSNLKIARVIWSKRAKINLTKNIHRSSWRYIAQRRRIVWYKKNYSMNIRIERANISRKIADWSNVLIVNATNI
jgi:hypothetical protein